MQPPASGRGPFSAAVEHALAGRGRNPAFVIALLYVFDSPRSCCLRVQAQGEKERSPFLGWPTSRISQPADPFGVHGSQFSQLALEGPLNVIHRKSADLGMVMRPHGLGSGGSLLERQSYGFRSSILSKYQSAVGLLSMQHLVRQNDVARSWR